MTNPPQVPQILVHSPASFLNNPPGGGAQCLIITATLLHNTSTLKLKSDNIRVSVPCSLLEAAAQFLTTTIHGAPHMAMDTGHLADLKPTSSQGSLTRNRLEDYPKSHLLMGQVVRLGCQLEVVEDTTLRVKLHRTPWPPTPGRRVAGAERGTHWRLSRATSTINPRHPGSGHAIECSQTSTSPPCPTQSLRSRGGTTAGASRAPVAATSRSSTPAQRTDGGRHPRRRQQRHKAGARRGGALGCQQPCPGTSTRTCPWGLTLCTRLLPRLSRTARFRSCPAYALGR